MVLADDLEQASDAIAALFASALKRSAEQL